jgi:RNA recognition motif-containing protein
MQNRTLFIGDLSIFCSEQDLYELFAKYGKVNEVRLKRDVDTQRNLSYGFVKFVTAKCAGDALKDLDGYYLHGRAMK